MTPEQEAALRAYAHTGSSVSGPLVGHSHLYFCQCGDQSIPRHECASSLDRAWQAAEAALPEGHRLRVSVYHDEVVAMAVAPGMAGEVTHDHSSGPTPAAALTALAAKLRSRP